jgi:hypothetical protein
MNGPHTGKGGRNLSRIPAALSSPGLTGLTGRSSNPSVSVRDGVRYKRRGHSTPAFAGMTPVSRPLFFRFG